MTTIEQSKSPGRPAFTFETPSRWTEEDVARTTTRQVAEPRRKTGLIPMQADSQHRIPIKDAKRPAFVTAKNRDEYPGARGFFFCLHKECKGEGWESVAELRAAEQHKKTPREFAELEGVEGVHVIGFWCTDDAGGPEEGCADCKKATAAAAKDKEGAVKACAKHARGVVGLLTPGELG